MSQLSYHEQVDRENILRLRNLIKDLPPFCGDFFRGIEPVSYTHLSLQQIKQLSLPQTALLLIAAFIIH